MDIIFSDDAAQNKPTRAGMGQLLAIGGLHVPSTRCGPLERAIEAHCASIGFPNDEQFKWSPGKPEQFQREKLIGENRITFFVNLLALAHEHGAKAIVVVADKQYGTAVAYSKSHEEDIARLFFERVELSLRSVRTDGMVIIAKPGGGSSEEGKFLATCLETIEEGGSYFKFETMPLGVVITPSRHMRLLQLADVVTSCTVARVSGESHFSLAVFEYVKKLLRTYLDRIGGVGLKIHPDTKYANLYHWLLGDSHFWKKSTGQPLPLKELPYANGPEEP